MRPGPPGYKLSAFVRPAKSVLPMQREGLTHATCWCERRFVIITHDDVMNLRTKPCGHPDCHPPQS